MVYWLYNYIIHWGFIDDTTIIKITASILSRNYKLFIVEMQLSLCWIIIIEIHIPLKSYSLLIYNYRVLYSKEVTPKKIEMWFIAISRFGFFISAPSWSLVYWGFITIPKLGNQKNIYKGKTRQRVLNTRTDVVLNVTQPFPRWWVWWLIIDYTPLEGGWIVWVSGTLEISHLEETCVKKNKI